MRPLFFRNATAPLLAAAFFLALLSPAFASAQDNELDISLPHMLEQALNHSTLAKALRAEEKKSQSLRIRHAPWLPENPTLAGEGGYRRDKSNSSPLAQGAEWNVHLRQKIDIYGLRGTRLQEADAGIALARLRRSLGELEIISRVKLLYYQLSVAHALREVESKNLALSGKRLAAIDTMIAHGAASLAEKSLAQIEHGLLQIAHREAEIRISELSKDLGHMVDAPPGQKLRPAQALGVPQAQVYSHSYLQEHLQANDRQLAVLRGSRRQLDKQLIRLRRERLGLPDLFMNVASQQPKQLFVGGGLSFEIPLWQRRQGDIALTKSELALNELEVQLLATDNLRDAIWLNEVLQQRHEMIQVIKETILSAAKRNLEQTEIGFTAGKYDSFRFIQAAREWAQAERQHLLMIGLLWQAHIEMLRTLGRVE